MNNKLKISFLGACQEVTGSNYLLEFNGKKILIDCGFFQGSKINDERNEQNFVYDPASVDALIITHAHLDHIGRIPKLVKSGFKGKIFSTAPTKQLSELMMIDSLGVLEKESRREGKRIIYEEKDVRYAMTLWNGTDYGEKFSVGPYKIILKDAGHILGSAMAEININNKKIVFTGDLGNSPEPLLNNTEKIFDADYMVIESTYGDKLHEPKDESELKLERALEDTLNKKGTLMIPAFSLERTQMIIYKIHNLMDAGRIPRARIFLDSPLSIKATKIYSQYTNYFNQEAKDNILNKGELFNFPNLTQTLTTEESKKIIFVEGPKVIIAGSGMCNGGRILHHLVNYLSGKDNMLLLVSYQAAGSLGRLIREGAKMINVIGEKVLVNAKVEEIEGFSSHPDKDDLYSFVQNSADSLKKVFVTHGELKANLFFVQKLRDSLGVNAISPQQGQSFEIGL
jgi:metallo-beta-lactamase family protein